MKTSSSRRPMDRALSLDTALTQKKLALIPNPSPVKEVRFQEIPDILQRSPLEEAEQAQMWYSVSWPRFNWWLRFLYFSSNNPSFRRVIYMLSVKIASPLFAPWERLDGTHWSSTKINSAWEGWKLYSGMEARKKRRLEPKILYEGYSMSNSTKDRWVSRIRRDCKFSRVLAPSRLKKERYPRLRRTNRRCWRVFTNLHYRILQRFRWIAKILAMKRQNSTAREALLAQHSTWTIGKIYLRMLEVPSVGKLYLPLLFVFQLLFCIPVTVSLSKS